MFVGIDLRGDGWSAFVCTRVWRRGAVLVVGGFGWLARSSSRSFGRDIMFGE